MQSPNETSTASGEPASLAIIGGTGKEGRALAARFAKAGVKVLIGSRDAARAQTAAAELNTRTGTANVSGYSNREAAATAEIVLLSIPYAGMQPILEDVRAAAQGKIVINIASALDPERKSRAKIPAAGSVTAEVQQFFGDTVRVVAAFQNISPEKLEAVGDKIDSGRAGLWRRQGGARARDRPDPADRRRRARRRGARQRRGGRGPDGRVDRHQHPAQDPGGGRSHHGAAATMKPVTLHALPDIPLIQNGDDLVPVILRGSPGG